MHQALLRSVLTTRLSGNVLRCRHAFLPSTAAVAAYHTTGRLCSERRDADTLFMPIPPDIFNRPVLVQKHRGHPTQVYARTDDHLEEMYVAEEYYRSRIGYSHAEELAPLWRGRYMAMKLRFSPRQEAQASLACAKHAEAGRYPSIYYNIDRLVDALYLLGRTDLERGDKYQQAAKFSLDHAAELGHLDAALLLHRLALVDRSVSAGHAAERIIKTAGSSNDWRAMVAYIESTRLRRIEQMRWVEIKETIHLLKDAMDAQASSQTHQPEVYLSRIPVILDDRIDVDALETFDPPARYMWQFCRYHYRTISNQPEPDKTLILGQYEQALREDAEKYHNPEAMYLLITLPIGLRSPALTTHSKLWIYGLRKAAEAGIPEAKLNYGFFLLHASDIFPGSAMQKGENRLINKAGFKLHDHEPGFEQLETSAELFADMGRPEVTACLYMIMAGILSRNGRHEDGYEYIRKSHGLVATSTPSPQCGPRQHQAYAKLLRDLDDSWGEYKDTGLYPEIRPAQIVKNPIIAQILMLTDPAQEEMIRKSFIAR